MHHPIALTIAGSDPSGGAGLQADLKTFHQFGVFGTSVVTLLTVQNTQGVEAVEHVAAEFVKGQLTAVTSDLPPAAAKTAALGTAELIEVVASCMSVLDCPIVVDPVMVSKHGHQLIEAAAIEVLRSELIPAAYLVTPNRHEAEKLTQIRIEDAASMQNAAREIRQLGAQNVLIKGGNQGGAAVDLLLADEDFMFLKHDYVTSSRTHGSGCVLSAAVTSGLALGCDLVNAVRAAKDFVTRGIVHAEPIGKGQGPLNLHVAVNGRRGYES